MSDRAKQALTALKERNKTAPPEQQVLDAMFSAAGDPCYVGVDLGLPGSGSHSVAIEMLRRPDGVIEIIEIHREAS